LPRLLNSFSNALVGKEVQESLTFYGDFWGDIFILPPLSLASQISKAHRKMKEEGVRSKDYGLRERE